MTRLISKLSCLVLVCFLCCFLAQKQQGKVKLDFGIMEESGKNVMTLEIDPADSTEKINEAVELFLLQNDAIRANENEIRRTLEFRLNGIRLKEKAGDISEICSGVMTDVDVHIFEYYTNLLLQGQGEGEDFSYAETGSYLGCR